MATDGNPYRRTALHLAVIAGDLARVHAALAAGEDVNAVESRSFTPLMFAVQDGFAEIAGVLLAAGADVEAPNSAGVTPLRLAAQRWRRSPDGAVIKVLKHHGASADTPDENGYTVAAVASNLFGFPPELLALLIS